LTELTLWRVTPAPRRPGRPRDNGPVATSLTGRPSLRPGRLEALLDAARIAWLQPRSPQLLLTPTGAATWTHAGQDCEADWH
jgi:hypothetical protein